MKGKQGGGMEKRALGTNSNKAHEQGFQQINRSAKKKRGTARVFTGNVARGGKQGGEKKKISGL